ncbi:MAG: Trp biosynthesis-associated membrane protein [Microbacterium sp.]|uniref:Trp biosynthesis-associated membrane protein n=1 Tax=Microbacterium sp. TaxID=51671 RepID=UPI0039E6E8A0
MTRRARLLSVTAILLAGAIGVLSSTQTWVHVTLVGASTADLEVAGADAISVLAPLSLAVLALGLALSIVGVWLRYAFAVLSIAAGGTLVWLTIAVLTGPPTSALAPTVTDSTGITGDAAVAELVAGTTLTAWPWLALAGFALLLAGGLLALLTASRWRRGGRKYETATAHAAASGDGPLDAIDSWDDLSRGTDPTGRRPID